MKQVKFIDRTFNCDHKHAMEIWRYIYEHDNGVTNFHFEISADILREEEIALLNRFRPGLASEDPGAVYESGEIMKPSTVSWMWTSCRKLLRPFTEDRIFISIWI